MGKTPIYSVLEGAYKKKMEAVGIVATAIVLVMVLIAALLVIISLPDIARYLRIRRMLGRAT